MIKIKLAGLVIELDNKYSFIEKQTADYRTNEKADFSVFASDEKIRAEKESVMEASLSDGYCESICLYREIAERLPYYDAFVFHGCVIAFDGGAYVFTAPSGVGKTTHAKNWLSRFGKRVHILNGDKPIIRLIDGKLCACGTPWKGKEDYGANEILPLKAIVFLERGENNVAFPAEKADVITKFMKQIYLPRTDQASLLKTLRLADGVLSDTALMHLYCNKDEESAEIALDALRKNICL